MEKNEFKIPEFLVLAGGFGTRLKKIVPNVPKPLAPISDKPFLYYFLKNWERQGVNNFTFLLHYNSHMIEDYITKEYKKNSINTNFNFIVEETPLGTAGAIKNAIKKNKINGDFLVSNADTWIENSLEQILKVGAPSIAVIFSHTNQRYGSVKIHENRIVSFGEKDENSQSNFINAGIYHLHSNYFENIKDGFVSLETDFFPKFLKLNLVRPIFLETKFVDIGIPKDYLKFVNFIKNKIIN